MISRSGSTSARDADELTLALEQRDPLAESFAGTEGISDGRTLGDAQPVGSGARLAVAAALRPPVRELTEGDHAEEHAAGAEHEEHDLAPLLRGRLLGEEQVEHRGEHGRSLPQSSGCSTRRSAKFAELFANSHQPCTCG